MEQRSVKIFHMADVHLDSPFSVSSPAESEQRRIQLRGVFSSAVFFAKREKIDIFLISGDLFDARFVTKDTVDTIIRDFSSFPSCKFFISPGNHDPYNQVSVYKNYIFPENVHIFSGSKECVKLSELGVCVYGMGFTSNEYISSPVAGYGKLDRDMINILVCHGDMTKGSKYGPVTENDIAASGFDYVALGHIHQKTELLKAGDTYYAYPGCLQGRGFDETGHKGAYFGIISKGNAELYWKQFSSRRYEWIECDVSGVSNKAEAIDVIRPALFGLSNDTALRITLKGTVKGAFILSSADFGESNALPYRIEIIDKTETEPDISALEKENTLKGLFYRLAEEKLQSATEEEKATLNDALKIGLAALEGRDIPLDI
jgi:DNA repair exonuclease SbcCD nuclease subunit